MPARTRHQTPDQTPDQTPEQTPDQTPDGSGTATTPSTRGRKALCRAAMTNGSQCELPKGHDGPHSVTTLDEEELADVEMTEEELAALLGTIKTPGLRPEEQLKVDAQVAENYAAWLAEGADTSNPKWKVKAVAIPKRAAAERLLRKAADFHDPKVGMRIKTGPIQNDKAIVLWAAVKRMTGEKDADTSAE